MYFQDLTPYTYGPTEPKPNVLNVGWLSVDHTFAVKPPDKRLVEALRGLVASPVNLYRGHHVCDVCPAFPTKLIGDGISLPDPPREATGSGEIRLMGREGVTYVAPVLVLHYVVAHNYAPPQEFVEAAIATFFDSKA